MKNSISWCCHIISSQIVVRGRDAVVDIANFCGLEGPRFKPQWGTRSFLFTILDQVSPETHPTSSTSDNGAHSMVLKTHLYLALRLRMTRNTPLLQPCASHGRCSMTFTFKKNSFVHCKMHSCYLSVLNTFTAIVDLSRFNNSCLKSRQLRP